jgi:hypothetical protein
MTTLFANSVTVLTSLLAQSSTAAQGTGGSGPSASLQWAIVLFMTILGLLVTLSPPRRTYEVKKAKED